MAIKKVKPTSDGRRFQTYSTYEEVTKTKPRKVLPGLLRKPGAETQTVT